MQCNTKCTRSELSSWLSLYYFRLFMQVTYLKWIYTYCMKYVLNIIEWFAFATIYEITPCLMMLAVIDVYFVCTVVAVRPLLVMYNIKVDCIDF